MSATTIQPERTKPILKRLTPRKGWLVEIECVCGRTHTRIKIPNVTMTLNCPCGRPFRV